MLPYRQLPDPVARLLPGVGDVVRNPAEELPELRPPAAALAEVQVSAVGKVAEGVVLVLPEGVVAEPHRQRAAVAVQVAPLVPDWFRLAADPVKHLEWRVDGGAAPGQPLEVALA